MANAITGAFSWIAGLVGLGAPAKSAASADAGMMQKDAYGANGTASRFSELGLPSTTRTRLDPKQSFGVSGTVIVGGYLQSNEKDPRLSGVSQYKTYSEILANVGIVAAGVRYFLGLVGKAEWTVVPADESQEAVRIAEWFDATLHGMTTPWNRIVRRQAMKRFYGFAAQEWTAKNNDDGSIGLLDIYARPQSTIWQWDVDPSGSLQWVVQWNPQDGKLIPLPRGKLWYTVDDVLSSSPAGLGLFRHCVSTATDLVRFEQLEGQGFNSDLRGVPIGRVPRAAMVAAGLSATDIAANEKPIEDFLNGHVRNEALSIKLDSATYKTTNESQSPSNVPLWAIELLRGDPGALAEMNVAIKRKTEEIARILGVEHLLLGAEGKGSLALSQTKAQDMGLAVDGELSDLSQSARADLVLPLMRLNGWDEKLAPTFETEGTNWRSPDEITAAIRDTATAGVTLQRGDEAVDEIYRMLGLTPPTEDLMAMDAMLSREGSGPSVGRQQTAAQAGKGAAPAAGAKPDQMPVTTEEKAMANA